MSNPIICFIYDIKMLFVNIKFTDKTCKRTVINLQMYKHIIMFCLYHISYHIIIEVFDVDIFKHSTLLDIGQIISVLFSENQVGLARTCHSHIQQASQQYSMCLSCFRVCSLLLCGHLKGKD